MPAANWTADNVTECAIIGHWTNGRPIVNIIHVQREEDDAAASARDVLDNWQDDMMDEWLNNYTLDGCRYRDRNEAEGVVGFLTPNPAKATSGGAGSAATSPNVVALIHKITEVHVGQRGGRLYCNMLPDAEVDEDGNISTLEKTAITTAITAFHAGLSGAGSNQLVVVHFAGPDDATGVVTEVTALSVDAKAATMRRRLRK